MKKNDDGYYTNRHSCFLLQYHLVLVTKYRHPVITGDIEAALKEHAERFFSERGMRIMEMETMPDHIHILYEAPPQVALSVFINSYKTESSRFIRKTYADVLAPYYWKPYFWSLTYFIGTVSEHTTEAVRQYIKNQKE